MGNQFDNKEASSFKGRMNVNGFGVLPWQVETARSIFERHPNIASEFPKNPLLRSFCMDVLLNITEAMSQSSHNISKGDLADANAALKHAGLNLKWLEEKLEKVSELKEIAEIKEELK